MSLALAGGNDASASLATIGLATLGPSGIVMDTAKAMSILGFSSSTTFEATSIDEINHAFMHKLHMLLRPPRASNKKGNPRAMADRKGQMRKLNEALQFLIKKRTKSKATEDWRQNGKRTLAVAMALQAMDEQAAYLKSEDLKEQVLRDRADKEKASKQALALAEELVAAIESIDAENRLAHNYVYFFLIISLQLDTFCICRKVIITLHHGAPLSFWQTTVVYDAKNNTIKYRQAQPCCNSYARKNTANTAEELLKEPDSEPDMVENNNEQLQETVSKPTISVEPYDSETEAEMPIKPHMKAIKSCGKRIKPCPATPKKPKPNLDNAVIIPKTEPPPLKTEKHIKLMSKQFQRRLGISNKSKAKNPKLKKRTEASINKHIQDNSRTNTLSSTTLTQSHLQAAGRGHELYRSYAAQLQHQALTMQIMKRRKVQIKSHRVREKKYSRLSHAPISTKLRKY